VCCSFKSLVGGQCSFDQRDRSQSIEIVPLLSCSKDITRHKSLWQFQDVKSEVDLILAHAAMFTVPQNVVARHIIHPLVLVGRGEPRGVGSLQRFQSIETSEGSGLKLTAE